MTSIKKSNSHYSLETTNGIFNTKNVILNSTVYQNKNLFDDIKIRSYYSNYEYLNNYQSSFMLYMTLKTNKKFKHHYQIIENEIFPKTLSPALFVSFSDDNDSTIAPAGHYSVTASIHTDLRWWIKLNGQKTQAYQIQKKRLKEILLDTIQKRLDIQEEEIIDSFCATPFTFGRYIHRTQLGGNAMTLKNFLPRLPANDTPFEGLYQVGDSVYPGQGWIGVIMGVENLKKVLHV